MEDSSSSEKSNMEGRDKSNVPTMTLKTAMSRRLALLLADWSVKGGIVRMLNQTHRDNGKEFTKQTATDFLQKLSQISVLPITDMGEMKKTGSGDDGKLCFVDKREGETRKSVIYLRDDAFQDMDTDQFLHRLVSAIQFVLGINLDSLLLFQIVKNPRQARFILDDAGIKESEFNEEQYNHTPGCFVPLSEHHLVDNDLHEFCEGEVVVYEVFDPLFVSDNSEENVPVYMYATILNEINDNDHTDTTPLFVKRYCIDLGQEQGLTKVSVTRLYRLLNKSSSDIDLSSLNQETIKTEVSKIPDQQTPGSDQTLSATLKDIHETLTKAQQVCEQEDFQRLTKRLLLKWHPDRNRADESFCARVVEAILNQVKENKQNQGDGTDTVDARMAGRSVSPLSQFRSRYSSRCETYAKVRSIAGNPQPGEGWRWLRTARCDVTAAQASRGVCEEGRNWVCFLCHQAVEKALKGILYLRDADNRSLQSHSLPQLARQVRDDPLLHMAQEMESRMGPHTRMRYPDVLVYPTVPADVYSEDDVNLACQLAWEALERAQVLMAGA